MTRSLVAAAVVLVLGACSSAPVPSSGPTSLQPTATSALSPMPTTTTSPPGTISPTSGTGGAAIQQGALVPGRYTTTAFDPKLTLTVGDGWRALFPDDSDELALEGPDGAFFAITRPAQVVDARTGTAVAAPDDLSAWLVGHPALRAASATPIIVSGIRGQSVDVAPNERDVAVFAYPAGNMHFPPGVRTRFHVLPLDGPDLVIVAAAPEASFSRAADRAQQIIDSLDVAGS